MSATLPMRLARRRAANVNTACAVARRKFPILGVLFANCTSLFVEEDIPSDKLGQNAHFASVAPSDRKGWIPDPASGRCRSEADIPGCTSWGRQLPQS